MAKYSLNAPYLVLTGVLLIAIVAGAVIYRPLYSQWQDLRGQQAQAQASLNDKQQFLAEIDSKKAQLAQLQPYENELSVILPNEDRFEDFSRIVHQAGISSGILVDSVSNSSAVEQSSVNSRRARGETTDVPDGVLPMLAQIKVVGSYAQLRSFVDTLEKSPRFLQIQHVIIDGGDPGSDQLQTQLQVRFYKRDTK